MAGGYYQDGGSLRTMSFVYYQDGGTLRTITAAYYQDGGTLRQWWPIGNEVNISDQFCYTGTTSPTTALATYALLNTGVAQNNGIGIPGEWMVVGPASLYDVRATVVSGTVSGGSDATGVWLNLGTTRVWNRNRVTIGTNTVVLTVEIRRVSDLVVIDTATITIEAEMSI